MSEEEVKTVECISCDSEIEEAEALTTNNAEPVCSDCSVHCERCGMIDYDLSDFVKVDSYDIWCDSCAGSYAEYCQGCEEYHTGDTYYAEDRSGSYCERCIDSAEWCDTCDTYNFDGCYHEEESDYIHDYSYRPDPEFHTNDKSERLFFGMEIEVEAPREDYSAMREAAEYAGYRFEENGLAYLKSDGSLSCGFEIVTHPMSHDFFKNSATDFWNTLTQLKESHNMRSWSAGTAGLHIHISRSGFSTGSHLHRFLRLVYENEAFYSRIAGRKSERWAKFDDVVASIDGNGKAHRTYKNKIGHEGRSDRYSAVNTLNRNTVELRIFRSTLNTDTAKSMLDLAHASVEYTRRLSVTDVRNGALTRINLIQYLHDNKDTYSHLIARLDRLFTAVDSE